MKSDMSADTTYKELLKAGENYLSDSGITESAADSFLLFSHVTGFHRADYFLKQDEAPTEAERTEYRRLLLKRGQHIPLQYITGEQEFMGLHFRVNESVLIPRQDTEILVETALPYVEGKEVLDLCTGSGCIAVSLSVLGKTSGCVAVDISKKALEVAQRNVEENLAEVLLAESDLFENVSGRFDIIVSNPPYIETKVVETLMEEVKGHEPHLALDGGEDGLSFYRRIISESRTYLKENGMIFFEIGCEQAASVSMLLRDAGFDDIVCRKDYAGLDRVVYGRIGGKRV